MTRLSPFSPNAGQPHWGPGLWAALALATAAPAVHGLNAGTDLDLSLQPIAGGMAGAAFTRPQEVAAALFGNPATLAGFKGFHFELGAALLEPEVDNYQSNRGYLHHSYSLAQNYVAPTLQESASRDTLALGHYRVEGSEWALGAGANFKF